VEEQLVDELGPRAARAVGAVQPRVKADDRQRGDRADAVEPDDAAAVLRP